MTDVKYIGTCGPSLRASDGKSGRCLGEKPATGRAGDLAHFGCAVKRFMRSFCLGFGRQAEGKGARPAVADQCGGREWAGGVGELSNASSPDMVWTRR